ncbi:MAG: DUF423 domain-containing protein [Gammaproteobacteria bacterium]|jgi:uncharacterized membrane protein YgdD (TMEM256/DUF423 family)|nr:DUF423 domain-containing protein [Gammaproteobacteria bacterium]MBT3488177.1 DUF423 domain-containing protein [Gammaproteobacteria bacterium]MBT3718384.1 DUF423 domain-containing protein [Gammaproteobacteria bacterium]MBT3846095.1 DUF423 domain-containing protein [Gammaproteobacteria bacterium]MBT3893744.1 DUF423 domain-containing protein [Gammaproteobacteria bacterium]
MNRLTKNGQRLVAFGAINAFLAVALGAFGAHGLQDILTPNALQTWHTGVDYHGFHALGLILVGQLATTTNQVTRAGWWLLAGITLFSGSLYLLALSGIKPLGIVTPFGGLCFLIGWFLLARALLKQSDHTQEQPEKSL